MKCIKCGTDNNLRDRTANQGRCKTCNHPFVFEPTSMGNIKFTDPFFVKAINDISANQTLFFTPKQFLYLIDQRIKKKSFNLPAMGCLYLFFSIWAPGFIGGFLSLVIGNSSFIIVLVCYNLLCIYYLFNTSNSPKSSYQTRKASSNALQILGIIIAIIGLILSMANNFAVGYFLAPLIGGLTVWLGFVQKKRIAKISDSFLVNASQIQSWLNAWARANGTVAQLLPEPSTTLQSSEENNPVNPDVTAYSFDRLVVCQSDEVAQMLIANNFHFENNSAVLSINGYPQSIFPTVMEMLRRNQDLMVYAFHDCSPQGLELIHRLRTSPAWFQEHSVTIIDLGLLPKQVLGTSKHLFIHRTTRSAAEAKRMTADVRQNLTTAELDWLEEGNYVELESFTPQRLIGILQRAIANSQNLALGENSNLILLEDNYSGYIYASDSFG